jgi:hypothetical protein
MLVLGIGATADKCNFEIMSVFLCFPSRVSALRTPYSPIRLCRGPVGPWPVGPWWQVVGHLSCALGRRMTRRMSGRIVFCRLEHLSFVAFHGTNFMGLQLW